MGLLDFLFFDIEGDKLVKYKANEKLIVVPKKIKTIGSYAFADSTRAKTLLFPIQSHILNQMLFSMFQQRIFICQKIRVYWN